MWSHHFFSILKDGMKGQVDHYRRIDLLVVWKNLLTTVLVPIGRALHLEIPARSVSQRVSASGPSSSAKRYWKTFPIKMGGIFDMATSTFRRSLGGVTLNVLPQFTWTPILSATVKQWQWYFDCFFRRLRRIELCLLLHTVTLGFLMSDSPFLPSVLVPMTAIDPLIFF